MFEGWGELEIEGVLIRPLRDWNSKNSYNILAQPKGFNKTFKGLKFVETAIPVFTTKEF